MNRGQSSLEFSIVIFAIIAALLAMQVYIRRGIQGRLRQSADELSLQQYEPEHMSSDITTTQNSNVTTKTGTVEEGGKLKTTTNTTIHYQEERRFGREEILP